MPEQEETDGWDLAELRAEVQKGLDQLESGEYLTFNSIEELGAHLRARIQQHLAAQNSKPTATGGKAEGVEQ
jgi:hypothetical protein